MEVANGKKDFDGTALSNLLGGGEAEVDVRPGDDDGLSSERKRRVEFRGEDKLRVKETHSS